MEVMKNLVKEKKYDFGIIANNEPTILVSIKPT
jgi:hypothetical protein